MARKDQLITLAAEELKGLGKNIANLQLEAASVISGLTGLASPSEVESLLASAGLAVEDVRLLTYFSTLPDDIRECLPNATLSLEAAKLLSVNPEIQDHAVHYLRHNRRLDVADVQQLIKRHWQDSLQAKELVEHGRSEFLQGLLASRLAAIENGTEELHAAVVELYDLMTMDPDEWPHDELLEHGPYSNEFFDSISEHARRILAAVDGVIDRDDLDAIVSDDAAKLLTALKALQRLADGAFAHNGGFGLNMSSHSFSTELQDAIAYLATPNARPVARTPRKELKVLELFAGAGGGAIGLMGAGFEHVALIEKSGDRADTLKKNWPSWRVVETDIEDVAEDWLKRHADIDLLAAGLPCAPGADSKDNPDLFPQVLKTLNIVKPRSFMLQYDKGKRQTASEIEFARLCSRLTESDEYRLVSFTLDPKHFGLPHSREHQFIVGFRNDVLGVFPNPSMLAPATTGTIANVLGPLMRRDRVAKRNLPDTDPQLIFNHWVDDWALALEERKVTLLPTVLTKEISTQAWLDAGFNTSKVADRLPSVGDPEVENRSFVPFITTEILAVAQGFPSEWEFLAKKHGILGMIADALPPVMAKVVGLAIRSVLQNEPMDLGKALTERVIDPARIGLGKKRPLNLNGSGRRWPLAHTKGSLQVRALARRVIAGEPIKIVKPKNQILRRKIKDEVEKIHAEAEYFLALRREAEEEYADYGPDV